MTATLTKWYKERGRHEIFAGGKSVALDSKAHSLVLNEEHVSAGRQTDLDRLGIAKTAREEKLRARDRKLKLQQDAENARMAKLYRQVVLKEQQQEHFVSIENLAVSADKTTEKREEVGSFGD